MSQHGYRNPLANGLREEEILDPPPSYQYNYMRSSTPNVATTQLLTSPPPLQNPFEPQMETQTQTQTQTQPHLPNTNNQVRIMPMPSNTQSFRIYLSQTDIRIHFGYPLHFVVFHSIFMTIISIVQICVDLILMSEDNSVIISIGGGVWSGLFLILTLFVTLMTTSYRNSCLILTSIFLHMFALFFTFLINIVPNTISLLDSNCSFDLEHCKSMLVFKMTTFLLASGILNMIMCAFYSIFMYSRLFHESNSNIKNVTQTPQMGQRTMNNAPQEYPQHRNPFESNYAANNPNYQTF